MHKPAPSGGDKIPWYTLSDHWCNCPVRLQAQRKPQKLHGEHTGILPSPLGANWNCNYPCPHENTNCAREIHSSAARSQYRGTPLSASSEYRSMPPVMFLTSEKPWCRKNKCLKRSIIGGVNHASDCVPCRIHHLEQPSRHAPRELFSCRMSGALVGSPRWRPSSSPDRARYCLGP